MIKALQSGWTRVHIELDNKGLADDLVQQSSNNALVAVVTEDIMALSYLFQYRSFGYIDSSSNTLNNKFAVFANSLKKDIEWKGLPEPDKMFKKSSHQHRKDSCEIDVFEAAKYFSGANEIYTYNNGATKFAHEVVRDHHHHQEKQPSRAGRFSLDLPLPMRNANSSSMPSQTIVMEKQMMIKEKNLHKKPSSPGGKLANFLNSLFNQTSSRKKKPKSTTTNTKSIKGYDQDDKSPGCRRKRRSSISHFQTAMTTNNPDVDYSKSVNSTTSSGFRTPPPRVNSHTKSSYKDLRSYSDHQPVISFSKQLGNHVKSSNFAAQSTGVLAESKQYNLDYAWLDEKIKLVDKNLQSFKNAKMGFPQTIDAKIWADHRYLSEENGFKKFDDADDGADSDSSSDLFELPNYDLDFYSSGLPVYETTNIHSIKRSAPISSAAAR
ncbi:hypothetical protein ACH5RR_030423 [Cinchona calisaya]|uniref:RNase H type-1 domain-containing protein n=1 Tax=Cinchona calisaya TaxID=153742 RepID=A0ABD2YYU5_9GENT